MDGEVPAAAGTEASGAGGRESSDMRQKWRRAGGQAGATEVMELTEGTDLTEGTNVVEERIG